ncbi:universal stress protein [Deinococcus sp. NW-56]|uniref:universal stress protein n=1 Tax=Deinococcus sp. NW-56 TaxID=2080419 RepID=UPI000CF51AB5|nr:universal stress protein [Deinococcus sp. NW-56]
MTLRILVPTDFSPAAGAALAVVRATFPDARTELLHVAPDRSRDRSQEAGALREQLGALGGGPLAFGAPAPEILRCAREGHFDLIALGRVGPRGPERGRLGAVAERVLREAPVPVLTVPVGSSVPLPPRVLVLMDFSDGARRAADFVARGWPGAALEHLHVIDPSALDMPLPLPALRTPALRSASSRALQERNALWEAEARRRLDGLGGGDLAWGSPAEEALKRVRGGGYGLIALGASVKGGLDRLMFGSVARRVVCESPLPVLTARRALVGSGADVAVSPA